MKIYFYKNASFKPTDVQIYDCDGVVEFFDRNHINPDEYVICDKCGNEYQYDYDLKEDIYVIFPKIAKGSKGKGWLGVILGIATILTAGATAGLLGLTLNGARMLGIGMLLSGAGTLIMGQQKLPSMDINTDSATKQNYQWNVGNLSTNRGVKGVTFGNDVIPEGELLAYRTYGTSSIQVGSVAKAGYYHRGDINDTYLGTKKIFNTGDWRWVNETVTGYNANEDGTSWLEMLIGCGEGELDSISDIKVNDTPIDNIEDANYEVRLGSNDQSAFPQTNLDNQVGIMSVGQTMPQKLAGSDNPLVITTSHACDSVLIACQSNLLYNMDTQSGAKNRCYLKPKIGYRLSGSTGAYTYVKTGISEIDNDLPLKAESAFYFNVAIKFPSNGIYEISLQNCSAEKCVQKGLLGSLPTVLPDRLQCGVSIDNIALYDNIEQTFPGTALIYLRLPASQALSGSMPKVTWKQSRRNTYVWNGSAYVAKPLDNLAWAIYDILAQVKKDGNTYHNEGEDVNNFDYAKFSDFADFCENLGLKGNWFLNKLDTAWSTAMSVATSARAFIGTRNGKISPFWDCETEMTQIFTVGNYESLSGAVNAKKDRARAIEATFNDEADSYKSKTIRVEVDDFAADAEAVGVTYVGLSTVEAVYKAAHYQLRKNKYLCQTIKFTANLDALVCELNDVIGVQCDITKYGVGGRLLSVNGNSISLDAPVTLNGGNYALLVAHDNGTVERMQITEHSGTLTTVTISGYTRAPKANEVYSFGVVNNEVKKYRVTSIVKTSDLKCEIEAVEYQPQVYVEGVAPDITYTNPNANISNIAVTYNPEGVDLAWHKDVNTAYVDVYVDGVYYGRFAEGATIPNVNSTQQVECVPVNAYGEEGTSVVRAISNSIPAPSQPPVPIVQALPTGVVAQFQIPQNQYITWIIIKEGNNELGRSIVAGDEVTLNLNLQGGTHHLTAYFLNSYGKTSTGRNFDATPFGIDSNMLSNGFLMKPQGSILRLSAKGCDSNSIKSANGVKDVSGYNHHGQAYGGVSVLDGGEGFGFDGVNTSYIELPLSVALKTFSNAKSMSLLFSVNFTTLANGILFVFYNGNNQPIVQIELRDNRYLWLFAERNYTGRMPSCLILDALNQTNTDFKVCLTIDWENDEEKVYVNGEYVRTVTGFSSGAIGTITSMVQHYIGKSTFNGKLSDIRIYPRALSATEVKSMYMLPDEAIFGQLNTDLIGANVINASNLVKTEALITESAQIGNAVITNAKISNVESEKISGANIQSGAITISNLSNTVNARVFETIQSGADINSMRDIRKTYYSSITEVCSSLLNKPSGMPEGEIIIEFDEMSSSNFGTQRLNAKIGGINRTYMRSFSKGTWGAWKDLQAWCYNNDTTYINGGNIYTNTIKASSIRVEALRFPNNLFFGFNAKGYDINHVFNNGDIIGDISGLKRSIKVVDTATGGLKNSSSGTFGIDYYFMPAKTAYIEIANSSAIPNWTFSTWLYKASSGSSYETLLSQKASGTFEVECQNNDGTLCIRAYNTTAPYNTTTYGSNTQVYVTVSVSGDTIKIYINGVLKSTGTAYTTGLYAIKASPILIGAWGANAAQKMTGYITNTLFFNRALSDEEIMTLYKLGTDTESGQITADRISTSAIKSRNWVAGQDETGTSFTTGTFLNLQSGTINSPNMCVNASGAKFKGDISGSNGNFEGALKCGTYLSINPNIAPLTLANNTEGYAHIRVAKRSVTAKTLQIFSVKLAVDTGETIEISASAKSDSSTTLSWYMLIKSDKNGINSGALGSNNCTAKKVMLGYDSTYLYISVHYSNYYTSGTHTIKLVEINSSVDQSILNMSFATSAKNSSGYVTLSNGLHASTVTIASYIADTGTTYIDPGNVTIVGISNTTRALDITGRAYCSSGTWSGSDINTKSQIKSESVLNRLKQISIQSWKYDQDKIDSIEAEKEDKEYKRKNIGTKDQPKHFGAMAEEFNVMFGTSDGSSDSLCYTDTIGVCMRAIQELATQLDDLKREVRLYKRILNISQEQINAERDNRAIRRLAIAQARQARRDEKIQKGQNDTDKEPTDENTDTLDTNTNSDGVC